MKRHFLFSLLCLFFLAFPKSGFCNDIIKHPVPCNPPEKIAFKPGTSHVTLSGYIQRFVQKCYVFKAESGQHISANLEDINGYSIIYIYRPGYHINYGNYDNEDKYTTSWGNDKFPINDYSGNEIKFSGHRKIKSVLPDNGEYLMIVTLQEGGQSSYVVDFSIK